MEYLVNCLDEYESYYKFYNIKDYKDDLTGQYETMENWINTHKEIKESDQWDSINLRLYEAKAKMEYANTYVFKAPVKVHTSYKGVYKCINCNFETKSKNSILSHYQSYDHFYTLDDNEGMEKCKCERCGKIFPTINKRIRHENMCKKPIKCNKCSKTFSTHVYLKKHVCKHPDDKIIPHCEVCNKTFASVQAYKTHLNTTLHSKKVALSQK